MKRIFILICISLFFVSCSLDNDQPEFGYEFLPIESVSIPDTFISGEVYNIEFSYFKPTNCHYFYDIYYDAEANTRTVAVVSKVYDDVCNELTDQTDTRAFNFYVTNTSGSYIFKFWQGENDEGEDDYLIYEIPIEQ